MRKILQQEKNNSNWDSFVPLSDSAITELNYWRLNLKTMNKEGRAIRQNQVCTLAICL